MLTTDHQLCRVRRLGRVDYLDALREQESLVDARRRGEVPDTLLMVEHPHVVTLGSGSRREHILLSEAQRAAMGITIHETTRGGDVTYHGPGQIVGYPILQLEGERRDAHRYLRDLEEVLIRALAEFGIEAGRHDAYTGVWVGDEKIAALGVRLTRWVTSHGFALNVDCDLRYFSTIVPCGIAEKGVTSMHALGMPATQCEVQDAIVTHFGAVFGRAMQTGEE